MTMYLLYRRIACVHERPLSMPLLSVSSGAGQLAAFLENIITAPSASYRILRDLAACFRMTTRSEQGS